MEPRDTILRAAQVVFARHGFRQTSMAMVAEEAGLSRQALYHHFASKEALFAALVDALHQTSLTAAKAAAAVAYPHVSNALTGVMLAYHRAMMGQVSGSPFMAELIEESGRQCGPAVAAFSRQFEKLLEGTIARLARGRRISLRAGVSARDLVEMVQTAAKGVKVAYAGEGEARYAQALTRIVDVICAGAEGTSSAKALPRTRTARRVAR